MLYVCVYVWICFWHICYKYNKNFSVYQIALISASIQNTIYDIIKHFVIIVCSLEKASISNKPCCDPYISVLARGLYLYHAAPLLIQCFPVGACFLRLLYLSFNHKVVDYYQAIYRHFTLVSVYDFVRRYLNKVGFSNKRPILLFLNCHVQKRFG